MELAYELLLSAITAVLLSFLVAKLVSLVLSGGEVSGGEGLCSGVDNGGGVEEGKLERRLKVEGSKSKKERLKKISAETVLVSEFKGETGPSGSEKILGSLVDDCEQELGSGVKDLEVEFSGIGKEDGCYDLDDPVKKNEGPIASYEMPLSESNQGNDLEVLGGCSERNERIEPKNDDAVEDQDGHQKVLSHKERLKKISADKSLVSEFKGDIEPSISAKILGSSVDDGEQELSSLVKDLEVEFSGNRKEENECPITSYEKWLIETNQGNDLEKLIDCSERNENFDPKNDEAVEDKDERRRVLSSVSDGEEWEGIERNELEKDFARAVNYVECMEKEGLLNELGSDVIMQLNDLKKVAIAGSCLEPQPMDRNLSNPAKWNSWQNLGSMNSEEAMEKYITLLSEKATGWMDGHSL